LTIIHTIIVHRAVYATEEKIGCGVIISKNDLNVGCNLLVARTATSRNAIILATLHHCHELIDRRFWKSMSFICEHGGKGRKGKERRNEKNTHKKQIKLV
jgi:hypothetical protein